MLPNQNKGNDSAVLQACTHREIEITQADLPLSCPPQMTRVWDAHPRVYLPVEETGTVVCPYCGTTYILKNSSLVSE